MNGEIVWESKEMLKLKWKILVPRCISGRPKKGRNVDML